ncbi:MAG: DUF4411 family protein [Dehalococcoidia bacterium]
MYTLDTCCFLELDGCHSVLAGQARKPDTYSALQRGLIWQGIEQLCRDGRLRIIPQVRDELSRHDAEALRRLQHFPDHSTPPLNNDLRQRYTRLMAAYPRLIPNDPTRDPADPWLIVRAQRYGYTIATEEKPKHLRTTKLNVPKIPDVCAAENVPWMCLQDLVAREKWLE